MKVSRTRSPASWALVRFWKGRTATLCSEPKSMLGSK
jgi:hypothetical protein